MENKSNKKQYIIITLIYTAIFLPLAFLRYPDARNELKYFIVAQDMIASKSYFILKYFSELYPDKPPLYFWILIFFKNNFETVFYPLSLIFGSLLPSLGIVLLNFKLLNKLNARKEAIVSTAFLITVPYFLGTSLFLRMDILMSFFITGALYLFFSMYYDNNSISVTKLIAMYSAIALGVLTKGGAGATVPLLVILSFVILEKNSAFLKKIHFFKGLLLIFAILGVWFYAIWIQPQGKEYLSLMLGQETIGRVVQAKTHSRPFYYYISRLPLTFYPYGIAFLAAIIYYLKNIKNYNKWNVTEKIGFTWSFLPLVFFSFVSGKLDIYLLPIYSGMALLCCTFLYREKESKIGKILLKITSILLVFPMVLEFLFNKWKNFNRSLIYIIGTTIVSYFSFYIFLPKYNEMFSLKESIRLMKNQKESRIIAYKFPDFLNASYELGKNIDTITDSAKIADLSSKEKTVIISREKYHKDIDSLPNLMLIYNNKAYYIYELK